MKLHVLHAVLMWHGCIWTLHTRWWHMHFVQHWHWWLMVALKHCMN